MSLCPVISRPSIRKTRKYANRVWIIRYSLCTHYNLPSHSYTYMPLQSVRARLNDTPVKIHTAVIIPWRRRATAGRWAQISQCALTECQFRQKIHTLLATEPRGATESIHSEKIETCSALIKKQFIGENRATFYPCVKNTFANKVHLARAEEEKTTPHPLTMSTHH